jgi:hypothetical protein
MPKTSSVNVIAPTPGSTITVTVDAKLRHHQVAWTAAQNCTVNLNGDTPIDGQTLTLLITNDGILPRVITLGTGLSGNGVITGVAGKKSLIMFEASGGTFYEGTRNVGVLG